LSSDEKKKGAQKPNYISKLKKFLKLNKMGIKPIYQQALN
jgi:hypothetical protein